MKHNAWLPKEKKTQMMENRAYDIDKVICIFMCDYNNTPNKHKTIACASDGGELMPKFFQEVFCPVWWICRERPSGSPSPWPATHTPSPQQQGQVWVCKVHVRPFLFIKAHASVTGVMLMCPGLSIHSASVSASFFSFTPALFLCLETKTFYLDFAKPSPCILSVIYYNITSWNDRTFNSI